MGCYPSSNNSKQLTEIKENKDRGCTDVLCLLLYIVFWGAVLFVVAQARGHGADPNRILRGSNLKGQICGVNNDDPNKKLASWPYPPSYKSQICVQSCDETKTSSRYYYINYESKAFVHWCIPSLNQSVEITLSGDFNADISTRAFADLWQMKYEILSSALLAVFLSVLYLVFVKRCASILIWFSIILSIVGGFFIGYTLLKSAKEIDTSVNQDNRATALKVTGWIFVGGTAVFALIILFARKRIKLAVKMVEVSTKVVKDIPLLITFPIFVGGIFVLYFLFWILLSVYVFSVGELVEQSTPYNVWHHKVPDEPNGNPSTMEAFQFEKSYRRYIIPHFFGLFWNTQFLIYFGYMVIAGAAADWYFTICDSQGNKVRGNETSELSKFPILESTHRILRYHLGSLCFGSLIIAIIKTLRTILAYVEEKTSSADPNILQKALFCILKCILRCVECCIDKISKTAFVFIAIYGSSFCSAAGESFSLLMRNLARVAFLNLVSNYLTFAGKVVVTILTTGIFAVIYRSKFEESISSPVLPCIVTALFAYAISSLFMVVFETIIDTMFVCFMVDLDHNADGQMMAPIELQKLVDHHKDASAEVAREKMAKKARSMNQDPNKSEPLAY